MPKLDPILLITSGLAVIAGLTVGIVRVRAVMRGTTRLPSLSRVPVLTAWFGFVLLGLPSVSAAVSAVVRGHALAPGEPARILAMVAIVCASSAIVGCIVGIPIAAVTRCVLEGIWRTFWLAGESPSENITQLDR